MDLGWVVTLASPTNATAPVTIIGNDDPAAPGISVEVDNVDAVHARAVELGVEIAYPLRDEEWGVRALHASRAERDDREHRLPPIGLGEPASQPAHRAPVRTAEHVGHLSKIRRKDQVANGFAP